MFGNLVKTMRKYAEIVAFGVTVGVSGYLCANGVMTQCVSVVAVIQNGLTQVTQ